MFKVNNKDTRTTAGIVLMALFLTLNIFASCSSVSTLNFEQVIASWATQCVFYVTLYSLTS